MGLFEVLVEYKEFYISGALTTISISMIALLFGCLIGIMMCMMKISKFKILKGIASVYIEVIRGTPLLVQLYIVYYGIPSILGISFPSILGMSSDFITAAFAVAVNSGAYVAEILRSGIQSVDHGQMEASRSLGMSYIMSMRYVIVPQAIRNVLPALANEFIVLVKESSIISVIGIADLMYNAEVVRGNTSSAFWPLIIAAAIYFIITFTLSKIVGTFENKLSVSKAV